MNYKLILILLMSASSFAQKNTSITYSKVLISDGMEKIVDQNVKNRVLSTIKNMSAVKHILIFNDSISYFETPEIMNVGNSRGLKTAIFRAYMGGKHILDKNKKTRNYQANLFGNLYNIQENYDKYSWTLTNESKSILGFKVFKATTVMKIDDFRGKIDHEITVWYAPELGSGFGPASFSGLPGIVLEVLSGRVKVYATEIKASNKKIFTTLDGKNVTEKEYTDIFNKGMELIRNN